MSVEAIRLESEVSITISSEVLGICIGMQIMCKSSKEGIKQGLGWIDAEVKKIEEKDLYPLPHMGWNTLHIKKDDKIFNDIIADSEFYFLHSYSLLPYIQIQSMTLSFTYNLVDKHFKLEARVRSKLEGHSFKGPLLDII